MKYTIKSKAHNSPVCIGNADVIRVKWDKLNNNGFIIVDENNKQVDIDDVGMDEIIEPEIKVEEKEVDNARQWPWEETFK